MAWYPTGLVLLSLFSAGICGVLASVGYRRQQADARSFAALMVGGTAWSAAYGVQLGFTTEAEQLLVQRVVIAASAAIPPLFLFFVCRYADRRESMNPGVVGVVAGEAVAFAGLVATNPYHNLVWTEVTLSRWLSMSVLDVDFGVGYYVHIVFAYLVMVLGFWILLSVYFRSALVYRRQSALLIGGAAPAFLAHVLFTLKVSPVSGLDATPFVFAFTGVVYGLALFHFDLLERTPVAHRRAMELTGDGLLVVAADGRVVDSNRIARELYGIDRSERTHVSAITDETDPLRIGGTKRGTVGGSRRVYDVCASELAAEWSHDAGFAVVLRDVTDQEAYERRLEVANRVLRHNLRNDMNVILGHAELLANGSPDEGQRGSAEAIYGTAKRLVSLSEKAHQMATLRRKTTRADDEVVDVVPVLSPLVRSLRSEHPAVTVAADHPDAADATVASKRALRIALQNLLENAVEHNETDSLRVAVAVTTDEVATRIRVSDTGSGLPETERRVLQTHTETPLEHSSGLGLWLTYWAVSATGGEIEVEASESAGTAITLVFPHGPESRRTDLPR